MNDHSVNDHHSNPSSLWRATAIVWNPRDIPDNGHLETGVLQRTNGGIAPDTRPLDPYFNSTQPHGHRILRRPLRSQLTSEGSGFPAPLDADFARGRPRNDVAFNVG